MNGHSAFQIEVSNARQCALFSRLGLRYPAAARAVNDQARIAEAAEGLRFPVWSSRTSAAAEAGIRFFATPEELREAVDGGSLELGLDGTALVQEYLPAENESIIRIEVLCGEFLYAIRLRLLPGSFSLCPADYCELPGIADDVARRGLPIEAFDPPGELVEDAKHIIAAARDGPRRRRVSSIRGTACPTSTTSTRFRTSSRTRRT